MAPILNLKVQIKSNHQTNIKMTASPQDTIQTISHMVMREDQTGANAIFKMVASAILDLMVRTRWNKKSDIKI